MTVHCTDQLSDYLDDELDADTREQVEAHLAACRECADVLAGLERVVRLASMAPQERPPAADHWPAIAKRTAARPPVASALPWRVSFSLQQLAAAAALVLVVGMASMWMLQTRPAVTGDPDVHRPEGEVVPIAMADSSMDTAIADLEAALAEGRADLDPDTVRILEESLVTIDAAIARAREALEADPANVGLTQHLLRARTMRLNLLRRAVAGTQKG